MCVVSYPTGVNPITNTHKPLPLSPGNTRNANVNRSHLRVLHLDLGLHQQQRLSATETWRAQNDGTNTSPSFTLPSNDRTDKGDSKSFLDKAIRPSTQRAVLNREATIYLPVQSKRTTKLRIHNTQGSGGGNLGRPCRFLPPFGQCGTPGPVCEGKLDLKLGGDHFLARCCVACAQSHGQPTRQRGFEPSEHRQQCTASPGEGA